MFKLPSTRRPLAAVGSLLIASLLALCTPGGLTAQSSVREEPGKWATINGCTADSPNYMLTESILVRGGCLISRNGTYWVQVRPTFKSFSVAIHNAPGTTGATRPVTYWNSGDHSGGHRSQLEFNTNGTLRIYEGQEGGWSSGTGGKGVKILIIADWGELMFQDGWEWQDGHNPDLNPSGKYRKRWVKVDRSRFVKGFGGVHTPTVGRQILAYDTVRYTTTSDTLDLSDGQSAHHVQDNCFNSQPITVTLDLSADITESRTWTKESSTTRSQQFQLEVGGELGPEVAKMKVSTSVSNALSRTRTESEAMTTSRTRTVHVGNQAQVPDSTRQTFQLFVTRTTTIVPYTALGVVRPSGYGFYVTRDTIRDEFTDKAGTSSWARTRGPVTCGGSD